jgi:hypothetical protein
VKRAPATGKAAKGVKRAPATGKAAKGAAHWNAGVMQTPQELLLALQQDISSRSCWSFEGRGRQGCFFLYEAMCLAQP